MTEKRTVQELVTEFHQVFGFKINAPITDELIKERFNLIEEEFEEFETEWTAQEETSGNWDYTLDPIKVAKELADLVYVLYGAAVNLGIDLDKAVELVHESNMSKLDEDGNPIINCNGKAMKGPLYRAPDMSECVRSIHEPIPGLI